MNYNNILISIMFFLTSSTVITNGILMIKEKDTLNFNNLSTDNKGYVVCLVYMEFYLLFILIYSLIFYFYKCICSCYSESEIKINYNCWKALYLLSGIGINIYLFIILITKNSYIDDNVNTINVLFNVNFFIIIFITILFYFLKKGNNKVSNYENIN